MSDLSRPAYRLTWGYFGILLVFWIVSAVLWATWGYHESFVIFNRYHLVWNDYASLYFFTHLADGVILPAILILCMWKRDPALAVTAIIAIYATGILTQTGKMTIFDAWNRPPGVFNRPESFSQAFGEVPIFHPNPPNLHSFPSGHATSFATGGLFFAYFLSQWKAWMGLVVGLFTLFLCYTRVTIGVHFPGDIFVGSMVGSLGGLVLLALVYPRLKRWFGRYDPEKRKKWFPLAYGLAILALIAQFIHLNSKISWSGG